MEALFEISNHLIQSVNPDFRRSLYSDINWQNRLIEIKGSRGVGKTTLLLQKAKETALQSPGSVLYTSLEDVYFYDHSIIETAKTFEKYGGKFLFIDEVHKYPQKYRQHDWSAELKYIYDFLPGLFVVYSGSSVIKLYKAEGDLSRRKSTYTLNGLSFREFLELNHILKFDILTMEELIKNHVEISEIISRKVKILPQFKSYLHHGYYPFYQEDPEQYFLRIKTIINVILEVDIPAVTELGFETISKIKKMLAVLASSVPYIPNLTQLAANLHVVDLRTLYKYLALIENAELITLLKAESSGNKIFHKPEKIFLNNTNIAYALYGSLSETGTLRETFICNQLNHTGKVTAPKSGDFQYNDNYVFEVGGKNKSRKQVQHQQNAYVLADETEVGFGTRIPLWLMGFLY